jgi:hypothetical protein
LWDYRQPDPDEVLGYLNSFRIALPVAFNWQLTDARV